MRRDDPYDNHRVWLRSKRIFRLDDGWYVDTRDGELGPYPFRLTAVMELERHLSQIAQPSSPY